MKKRIFIILLTLCLAITAMTVVTMAETVSGNGWSLDTETGELIIDDTMGSYYWANTGRVTYGSLVVTATIKSGNSVEAATFEGCRNLVSVSLPNGLQIIRDRAFCDCLSLTSIEIPSSVTSIESNAFYGTRITSVTLSCGTTYAIDSFPTSCTITQAAHTYVNHVCSVCGSLDCIAYGNGWVLGNDGTLTLSSDDGMEDWIENSSTYCASVKSVVFDADYEPTEIMYRTFLGCSNLESIIIPETVTKIGNMAFYGCVSLISVTVPSGVNTIEAYAFTSCMYLQLVTFESCATTYESTAFYQTPSNLVISQPDHTYSGGVCTVCGKNDTDYVTVGAIKLSGGDYTTDGVTIATITPTDNYAYYSNGVLYLKNFTYIGSGNTQSTAAVISPNSGSLTISLSGSSTIGGEGYGIYATGGITIESTSTTNQGSLTVSNCTDAIRALGNIVIDNVTIKSSGAGIGSNNNVTIENGANIEASEISSGYTITISYSTVVVNSTGKAIDTGGLYIVASDITLYGMLSVTEGTINPATNGVWKIYYGNSATDCQSITYSSELEIGDVYYGNSWHSCTYFRIAEHEHTYTSEVTKEATCTSTGTTTYTCTLCGDKYTETIAMVAHTVVTDEAVAATCTSTGLTAGSHCSVCSAVIVEQEVVAATGHTKVTDEAVAATCTSTGLTAGSHCSVCNTVLVEQEVVEATGHDYEISYFTWADGYKSATATFACANCSDEQTVDATVTVENYYGMYVYVATARYGASGATYSSVKTVGTVDMSSFETNSTEEVETEEPVEGTDTETEADEDLDPIETPIETNPTTGIVVALLPMAIAMAGAVAGRKRLG